MTDIRKHRKVVDEAYRKLTKIPAEELLAAIIEPPKSKDIRYVGMRLRAMAGLFRAGGFIQDDEDEDDWL